MRRCWAALAFSVLGAPAPAAETTPLPYLDPALLKGVASLLPPPPAPGSDAQLLDGAIFLRTRSIRQNDPARWDELRRQTLLAPEAMLQSFGCALGIPLKAATPPGLAALWRRAAPEIEHQLALAQSRYRRRRPFLHVHQPICVPRFTRLDRSPSYPSREAALGWSLALILAEVAPGRAGTILSHGRDIGQSRVACGVNWQSDVAAGELDAAALVAVLHASPSFRADLAASGREVAASGKTGCTVAGDR